MVAVSYILCLSITLASGTVRSFKGLQPWLQENTKGTHTRYSSMLLHSKFFFSTGQGDCGGLNNDLDCPSPTEYVLQRMGRSETRVCMTLQQTPRKHPLTHFHMFTISGSLWFDCCFCVCHWNVYSQHDSVLLPTAQASAKQVSSLKPEKRRMRAFNKYLSRNYTIRIKTYALHTNRS